MNLIILMRQRELDDWWEEIDDYPQNSVTIQIESIPHTGDKYWCQ